MKCHQLRLNLSRLAHRLHLINHQRQDDDSDDNRKYHDSPAIVMTKNSAEPLDGSDEVPDNVVIPKTGA